MKFWQIVSIKQPNHSSNILNKSSKDITLPIRSAAFTGIHTKESFIN